MRPPPHPAPAARSCGVSADTTRTAATVVASSGRRCRRRSAGSEPGPWAPGHDVEHDTGAVEHPKSASDPTTATAVRSVTSMSKVDGHDRLTRTEATEAMVRTRCCTASVSTSASGVPSATAATARTCAGGGDVGSGDLDRAHAQHRRAQEQPARRAQTPRRRPMASHQALASRNPGRRPTTCVRRRQRSRHRFPARPDEPPAPLRPAWHPPLPRRYGAGGQRGEQFVAHERDRGRAHGDDHVALAGPPAHLAGHVLPRGRRTPCARAAGRSRR